MNALGLSLIMKMGCICTRESVNINGTKYSVIENLGQGGFSMVDLIENTRTRKKYALKRIKCHSIEDQRTATVEINYCKKLRHSNIIELIDSTIKGSADIVINTVSEAYLVLPYFKRGTLHDLLQSLSKTGGYLESRRVLRLFLDVCSAVQYLHSYKPEPLAHRDLKTANIMLTDEQSESAILMDLGSIATAKVTVCGTQDAQHIQDIAAERCSMAYRAPELFHVESYCVIDQRTDIWSLGCLLYACCYYKSPYDPVYERGDSVALAVISGNINYPSVTPYVQDFHDLIEFMIRVNASDRPFIDSVIDRTQALFNKLENVV